MTKRDENVFDIEKYRSIGVVGARLRGDRSTFQRDWDRRNESELADYRQLRKEGVQPDGTHRRHLDRAKRMSDALGVPYRGDDRTAMAKDAGLVDRVTPIRRKK